MSSHCKRYGRKTISIPGKDATIVEMQSTAVVDERALKVWQISSRREDVREQLRHLQRKTHQKKWKSGPAIHRYSCCLRRVITDPVQTISTQTSVDQGVWSLHTVRNNSWLFRTTYANESCRNKKKLKGQSRKGAKIVWISDERGAYSNPATSAHTRSKGAKQVPSTYAVGKWSDKKPSAEKVRTVEAATNSRLQDAG